jgi:hypothetical protein
VPALAAVCRSLVHRKGKKRATFGGGVPARAPSTSRELPECHCPPSTPICDDCAKSATLVAAAPALLAGSSSAPHAGQLRNVENLRDDRSEFLSGGVVRFEQLPNRRTHDCAEWPFGRRHLNEPDERLGDLVTARASGALMAALKVPRTLSAYAAALS